MEEASSQPGRRQRKKAAIQGRIASTALDLFLQRGFDAVGVREIAAQAGVALATVFAYFPTKEALVFNQDASNEAELIAAVTERAAGITIPDSLRRYYHAAITEADSKTGIEPFRLLAVSTESLREYAQRMWLRHEGALTKAIVEDTGAAPDDPTCRALARFCLQTHTLARSGNDPHATVDAVFDLIAGGWDASRERHDGPAI